MIISVRYIQHGRIIQGRVDVEGEATRHIEFSFLGRLAISLAAGLGQESCRMTRDRLEKEVACNEELELVSYRYYISIYIFPGIIFSFLM